MNKKGDKQQGGSHPKKKRKVHVVKVEPPAKPEDPTLVTIAVHEPIPLPPVPLPSEPVEIELTSFGKFAARMSEHNAGIKAWIHAHLW